MPKLDLSKVLSVALPLLDTVKTIQERAYQHELEMARLKFEHKLKKQELEKKHTKRSKNA